MRLPKELEREILSRPDTRIGPGVVLPKPTRPARASGPPQGASVGSGGSMHVLYLPGYRPSLLNPMLRKHWAVRNRDKKEEYTIIQVGVFNCGIPRATGKRKVEVFIHLALGRKRSDDDAPFKVLLDGLVRAGALVDDSPKWCQTERPRYYRCVGDAAPGTMIVLTDL